MARTWSAGRGAAACVGLVAVLVAGCGAPAEPQGSGARPPPTFDDTPGTEPEPPAPGTPAPTASPPPRTASPPSTEGDHDPALLLQDGRHAAYLHALDVRGRTLTVDVIQFLTGQEAVDAYHRDHPDDPYGPPNDYYILNENPRLRTLTVDPATQVRLVRLHEDGSADLGAGTWEELPVYLSSYRPDEPNDSRLSWNPFWLTVGNGQVVVIEEQYVP